MKQLIQNNKRGGASMFVVMFTILILSIIVLGFTNLIISEATKTSNTDLSQSAYDSALAGVEDAKIALLKYHSCLDQGYRAAAGGNACEKIIANMQEGIKKQDCSTIAKVLGRESNTGTEFSVVVQETADSSKAGNNKDMMQAYTCVTIKEDLNDYRTTLDSSNRLRIIPIRSADIDSVDHIYIQWFSSTNYVKNGSSHYCVGGDGNKWGSIDKMYSLGNCNGGRQAPTTLSARLIQTDEQFNLSELSAAAGPNNTDTGQLYLLPKSAGSNVNYIESSKWGESANKGENLPIEVNCKQGTWFCSAYIGLPNTFRGGDRNDANTYLLVSIPYGSPETDISVEALKYNGGGSKTQKSSYSHYDFTGVQARIDSTGRANDLWRRVETRVELVDTYFAYPEFEITMRGDENSILKKSFDVTFNCWSADNGIRDGNCPNAATDDGYANF